MKSIVAFLLFAITVEISLSQPANSPYPLIFVHGLNSDDQTWNTTLAKLSSSWIMNSGNKLNFVLNARGGDTTYYIPDVVFPLKDASGSTVNTVSNSIIYLINFGNFWNRNPSDPRILLYDYSTPGTNQSPGNQSAIYKQAYALSILIDSVLRVTGAEKVILVGHSMGGLAIREYLQRRENGIHKWWVDPGDSVNGHKVARVVTTGTPHLGTNNSIPFTSIDNSSEAMRDMKVTYTSGSSAAYIFGNPESFVPSSFYNADINCNGSVTDTITGISSGNAENPSLPLPDNILYTWITSNYLGLGTDIAVPTVRQWLHNGSVPSPAGISDTLLNTKNHLQQTSDTTFIIRGLDEPDKRSFAYKLDSGKLYSGFITLQSGGSVQDTDYYYVKMNVPGILTETVRSSGAGVASFALISDSGTSLVTKSLTTVQDSISYKGTSGKYYLRITGNSSQNPSLNSYRYSVKLSPAIRLNLTIGIEGMWNGSKQISDTIRINLRSSSSPFSKIDSATVVLDSLGSASMFFMNAEASDYYVQTDHRNALETWSSIAPNFVRGVAVNYDFTNAQSQAYGSNQTFKTGRWCIYSGDVDGSSAVDLSDIVSIYNDAQIFATGYISSDLTGDGYADVSDLIIAFNNSSAFVTVITP